MVTPKLPPPKRDLRQSGGASHQTRQPARSFNRNSPCRRIRDAFARAALIDDLARAPWDSQRGGMLDDVPLD